MRSGGTVSQLALAPTVALLLWGCAATTPPPRLSSVSPADPAAPEAAAPPASPMLTGSGELAEAHEAAQPDTYTCVMHPQVATKAPGSCPVCGMTLVKKQAGKPEGLP